jgi:membrane-associated phospholipid phosphatase
MAALILASMGGLGLTGALAQGTAVTAIDPGAGSWRTWVLGAGRELRLAPPPDERATAAELGEIRALADQRDAAALERIRYWEALSPSHRWNELLTDLGVRDNTPTGAGFRSFAMLNVALHDAMIAAWDSKYAHRRPRPGALDARLAPAIATPPSPSYPCERAVAAGAGAAVLAHLFPKDAARLAAAAEEAARSRVQAGVAFPSDARAGLELGRAVAARVIDHMKLDGQKWTGTVPVGPGLWKGANPAGIDAVRWRTFLLTSPGQFRAPAPPAADSPERAAELAEVRSFTRTPLTSSRAFYWQFGGWGQAGPHYLFSRELAVRLHEAGLDASAPRAARAYALVHLATYEAFIASQESKFHYWTARPGHFDPAITTLFPTPNFPTYPSNAAAVGMAPMLVLGYLFPREAARYEGWAREFGDSRIWSGIHFRSDVESGYEMGRRVAALVVDRARRDGAE